MVEKARAEFERWASELGFSKQALQRTTAGDYAHIHAHYAWAGFRQALTLGTYCQICGRELESLPGSESTPPSPHRPHP